MTNYQRLCYNSVTTSIAPLPVTRLLYTAPPLPSSLGSQPIRTPIPIPSFHRGKPSCFVHHRTYITTLASALRLPAAIGPTPSDSLPLQTRGCYSSSCLGLWHDWAKLPGFILLKKIKPFFSFIFILFFSSLLLCWLLLPDSPPDTGPSLSRLWR